MADRILVSRQFWPFCVNDAIEVHHGKAGLGDLGDGGRQHFGRIAGAIGWIPYAASGVGSFCGGALSSWLLRRGKSVNVARKVALGASAALMPWVMLVPSMHSVGWVIFIFSVAFFGQQSWSTLVMILPTDLIDRRAVGTLAGMVGLGGAMGGVLLGQIVGYLRDHGHSYTPALVISGSLHVLAFAVICVGIPRIKTLDIAK